MIVPLAWATVPACGGKAGALGALLRAGLPVPDGVVVTFDAFRAAAGDPEIPLPRALRDTLSSNLAGFGDAPLAVRSSAAGEDTAAASGAGQYESVLGVRGVAQVADAVRACWASMSSARAVAYRRALDPSGPPGTPMAVLVQRLVDAEVSGVMFVPDAPTTVIEASWGLGPSVVGGTVAPDVYRVTGATVRRAIATKPTRVDRHGSRLVTSPVPGADRDRATLDDAAVAGLARLGQDVAAVLGAEFGAGQDVEWAIAGGRVWIVQARPITAAVPAASPTAAASPGVPADAPGTLRGTPGSRGIATGTARVVRGPRDFARVRPGDVLVCPHTDPAWTPLLRVAAGVVTEVGGALSHAAIVAREQRVPAVLGVTDATRRIRDGAVVTLDGAAGTVTLGRTDRTGRTHRTDRTHREEPG